MTLAVDGFGGRDRTAIGRWGVSLLVVLALHAGLALLLLSRRITMESAAAPPAAVMLDLAPLPAAVPADLQRVTEAEPIRPPPEPEIVPLPEPEPLPVPEPEITLPPPEAIPAPQPAVTLPAPQPKRNPKPRPRPVDHRPLPPREVIPAPPAPAPPVAVPSAAAPPVAPAPSPIAAAAARANWQSQLLGWLSRHKRYPRPAPDQRQQGTAYLRFVVDRQGRVLSFRLDRSSGFPLLDEEVSGLIQRAQPLPPPPPEISGERIELVVPVEFSLRRNQP